MIYYQSGSSGGMIELPIESKVCDTFAVENPHGHDRDRDVVHPRKASFFLASQAELHLCNATCVYVCYMYPFTNLSSSIMALRDHVRVCICSDGS